MPLELARRIVATGDSLIDLPDVPPHERDEELDDLIEHARANIDIVLLNDWADDALRARVPIIDYAIDRYLDRIFDQNDGLVLDKARHVVAIADTLPSEEETTQAVRVLLDFIDGWRREAAVILSR